MLKKISKIRIRFVLIVIFLIALFFRFYKITEVPFSLNWDETTFGYNAYSILETGMDEYGVKLPLSFKSIGDYKCPLYIYLMVPIIRIFGLNEFSVRFLPSFLGALTIPLIYLIAFQLFNKKSLAFYSSIILAISPWHLQFTRAGADVSISTFFLVLGIWLFLLAVNRVKQKAVFFTLSFSSFILTFYSYYGERFFTPLIVLLMLFYFRKELLKNMIALVKSLIIPIILFIPIVGSLISSGHQNKILMTTIFGYNRPESYVNNLLSVDNKFVFSLFHSDILEKGLSVLDHYLNHFSPFFLFINGPQDNRQRIEGMGMLYWSDFILLLFAIFSIIKIYKKEKNLKFIFLWLAIAPLPSAITRDIVHARRSFNMIYPLSIILALGLNYFIENVNTIKNKIAKWLIYISFSAFFLWSFGFYMLSYYVITPFQTFKGSGGWQYGYKQLVSFVSPLKNNYDKVIIDTTYQGPYVFFLFYEKYPPVKYQPQAQLIIKEQNSLGEGKGYDNYIFRDIYWPNDRGTKKTLFAGPPERIPLQDIDPKQSKIIGNIYFPDGSVAFRIVETF